MKLESYNFDKGIEQKLLDIIKGFEPSQLIKSEMYVSLYKLRN